MAKTAIARIRMEPVVYDRFSMLAQEANKDLGPYLLERLLEVEQLDQRLEAMHRTLARIEAQGSGPATSSPHNQVAGNDGMLLEMLLLARQIAGPQKAKLAGAEVERNGLDVWQGV